MVNINQLSQLQGLQNVSQGTSNVNKQDGADFLSLLKKVQEKNSNKASEAQVSTQANNFSSTTNSLNTSPAMSGTEAFLSNMQNVKGVNPLYNAIDTVNQAQITSNKSAAAFAAGYGDELQVVLDVSKAEKYLQLFSEVRVKFVNAIKELARTQI